MIRPTVTLINKSSTKSINRRWKKMLRKGHVGFNPTFQLTGDQFSLSWISPLFFASCLVRDLLQVHSSRKSVVSMHEINGSLTFQRKVAGCWADFILKKNYNRHIMNLGWSSASIIDVVCLHTKYIGAKQNPR